MLFGFQCCRKVVLEFLRSILLILSRCLEESRDNILENNQDRTKVIKCFLSPCTKCVRPKGSHGKIPVNNEDISNIVKCFLRPCTNNGMCGFCKSFFVCSILSPFVVILLAILFLLMFPTTFITGHLIWMLITHIWMLFTHIWMLFKSPLPTNECLKLIGKQLFIFMLTAASIVTFYSFLFMLAQVIYVGLELLLYTLIGIILDESVTQTFGLLCIIILAYAKDCFGHVVKRFLGYNKIISKALLDLGVEKEGNMRDAPQNETLSAYHITSQRVSDDKIPILFTKSRNGSPNARIRGPFLFLSKDAAPYVPKSFFFDACKMPFEGAPGVLWTCYLKATLEFGLIVVFILFVLLVVLALGESYKISASNQLLATLVGSLMPKILQSVLFKTHSLKKIDKDSLHFKHCLNKCLEKYEKNWSLDDIIVEDYCSETTGTEPSVQFTQDVDETASTSQPVPSQNMQILEDCDETTSLLQPVSAETTGHNDQSLLEDLAVDIVIDTSPLPLILYRRYTMQ